MEARTDAARVVPRRPSSRLRPAVDAGTLLAAAPLWGTGAWFGLHVLRFLAAEPRSVSLHLGTLSQWPLYEGLAWLFSVLLPLSGLLGRALHRAVPARRLGEHASAAVLLALFTLVAWRVFAPLDGAGWLVLGFLLLAGARWLAHARAPAQRAELARAAGNFVKLYAAGTAAFLLFGLTCVPLLALFGPKLGDGERQTMIMVGLGAWYFVILGSLELLRCEETESANRAPGPEPPHRVAPELQQSGR